MTSKRPNRIAFVAAACWRRQAPAQAMLGLHQTLALNRPPIKIGMSMGLQPASRGRRKSSLLGIEIWAGRCPRQGVALRPQGRTCRL